MASSSLSQWRRLLTLLLLLAVAETYAVGNKTKSPSLSKELTTSKTATFSNYYCALADGTKLITSLNGNVPLASPVKAGDMITCVIESTDVTLASQGGTCGLRINVRPTPLTTACGTGFTVTTFTNPSPGRFVFHFPLAAPLGLNNLTVYEVHRGGDDRSALSLVLNVTLGRVSAVRTTTTCAVAVDGVTTSCRTRHSDGGGNLVKDCNVTYTGGADAVSGVVSTCSML